MRTDLVDMQFGTQEEGVILLYSRAGSKGKERFVMNGLSANKSYVLTTVEGKSVASAKGSALIKDGFTLSVEQQKAYIILYKEA